MTCGGPSGKPKSKPLVCPPEHHRTQGFIALSSPSPTRTFLSADSQHLSMLTYIVVSQILVE